MVRKYCYEDISKIENYDKAIADKIQTWHCHHRLEIMMNCGIKELKNNGYYYNRPANELIFLTKQEHMSLHAHNKKSKWNFDTCMTEAKKYHTRSEFAANARHAYLLALNRGWLDLYTWFQKKGTLIRIALQGKQKTDEHKRKMSEVAKGRHWYNNGIITVSKIRCPEGFVAGRL